QSPPGASPSQASYEGGQDVQPQQRCDEGMELLYEDPDIREIGHDRTVAQGPIGADGSRTRYSPHGSPDDDRGVCRDGPEDRDGLKKSTSVDRHGSRPRREKVRINKPSQRLGSGPSANGSIRGPKNGMGTQG